MSDLVERLNGVYRIPIKDGLGPAGGEEPGNANEFVRTFPTPPIQKEAAARIRELEAEVERLRDVVRVRSNEADDACMKWDEAERKIATLRADLKEAVEIIGPFADAEEHVGEPDRMPDDSSCVYLGALGMNVGHFAAPPPSAPSMEAMMPIPDETMREAEKLALTMFSLGVCCGNEFLFPESEAQEIIAKALHAAEIRGMERAADVCLDTYDADGHAAHDWPCPEECSEAILAEANKMKGDLS